MANKEKFMTGVNAAMMNKSGKKNLQSKQSQAQSSRLSAMQRRLERSKK